MRKNVKTRNLLILSIFTILVLIVVINVDIQVFAKAEEPVSIGSYPVSYVDSIASNLKKEIKIENTNYFVSNDGIYKKGRDGLIEIDFNDGLLDKNKKEFYYTIKSQTSWGSEKYIYVYSLSKKTITRKIEFDNSGYEKYPIAISPNSKTLALAERAQSVGEVNITLIDLESGKEVQTLSKLYAPTLAFENESSIVYLEPILSCNKEVCTHEGILLKQQNLKTKEVKSKRIANKNADGSLPSLDNLELVNGDAKISSRLDKLNNSSQKKEVTSDLKF